MKVTEAERDYVLANRARIELDNRDWSKEPFVTDKQLLEMSMHVASTTFIDWPYEPKTFRHINPKFLDLIDEAFELVAAKRQS
jgi:hypothetical protein